MIARLLKSMTIIIACIYLMAYMLLFTITCLLKIEMSVEMQLDWTQRAIVALSLLVLQPRDSA